MPTKQSEKLFQLFKEVQRAETIVGMQAQRANERRKRYMSAAWTVICILLFTLALVLFFNRSR